MRDAGGVAAQLPASSRVAEGQTGFVWQVENGKAQLVAIAHDVDPIELVVWLPALCKKMGVPYCIVKVRPRTAAAMAGQSPSGVPGLVAWPARAVSCVPACSLPASEMLQRPWQCVAGAVTLPVVRLQGKARLGQVVHKKTATAVALTVVKNEDQREFAKVCFSLFLLSAETLH